MLFRSEKYSSPQKGLKGEFDISFGCGRPDCSIRRLEAIIQKTEAQGASASNEIPAQFIGTWSDDRGCKAYKNGAEYDPGFEITSNTVNSYEKSCQLKETISISQNKFLGKFTCAQEGEHTDESLQLNLDSLGRLQSDGKANLKACKK